MVSFLERCPFPEQAPVRRPPPGPWWPQQPLTLELSGPELEPGPEEVPPGDESDEAAVGIQDRGAAHGGQRHAIGETSQRLMRDTRDHRVAMTSPRVPDGGSVAQFSTSPRVTMPTTPW